MHIGIGLGITTLRQSFGSSATVPSTMVAPALAQVDQSRLSVTRGASPLTGGSAILSYDLRFSTDQVTWTVVAGIAAVQQIAGLAAGTLYFVQTRAVNAVGPAGWSVSASLSTVVASPGNTSLPIVSGTATVGYVLTVTNGVWTGSPSGFGYQWKRGGVAISGATLATYTVAPADTGLVLTCTVTATNAGGSTSATGAGTVAVTGTDANVTAINADAWSATYTSPPTFDPVGNPKYVVAQRQGYDATGTAITLIDVLILTQRVRQPYPSQASLTTNRVALSDYIYSTDTVLGVTNSSAEVSPKPIANWALPDHAVVGNTIRLEVVAFHRNARGREQVACVEFRATDGTTTVSQKVSQSVISGRTGDANPIIVYQCDLDISTLANPATVTVNAKVYPFVGGAASIADSTASAVLREFSPRIYRRHTTLAASPVYTYVDAAAGNDTTGVVSTTAATASATPCLTIGGAIKRLVAVNGIVDGCIIRLKAGTHTLNATGIVSTQAQSVAELLITRDPAVAQSAVILQYGTVASRMFLGAAGGWLRISDVTFNRTGPTQQIGEGTSRLRIVYENMPIDNGLQNVAFVGGACDYILIGTPIANWSPTAFQVGNPVQLLSRGVSGVVGSNIEGWLVLGCSLNNASLSYGTRSDIGSITACNRFTSPSATAGVFAVGGATATNNVAFCGNLVEWTSATANPAIRVSADGAAGSTSHIVLHHNTVTGFYLNGRCNIFYDEGATRRTHKLMSVRGNIWNQINTKSDVFRGLNEVGADASSAVGNWAYLYGVGCQGEFSQFIDANNEGIGGRFAQAYPGLQAKTGTSNTVRQDPLFTTYAGTTAGPTAGAGGGVYTIGGASPATGTQTNPTLRFDLAGVTRSAVAASAGAYE